MPRTSLIFALLLCLNTLARANGVYIPDKAYPSLPTIPVQRAIIVHKNNIETLIVESAFQTDSKNVAWILPLPAVPTKLDVGDPGMITSTCIAIRPKISPDLEILWMIAFVLSAITLPFALNTIFTRDGKRRRSRFVVILLVEFIFIFFCGLLLPSLGGTAFTVISADTAGITTHSTQRLGDYQTTVLTAKDPQTLSNWLSDRALKPLDAAAMPIVADYIARGWCFVVTQLHSSATGTRTPQPLVASFPAAAPIFPMKLTALANTTTHVELCIIADQQAAASNFHCEVADRFIPVDQGPEIPLRFRSISTGIHLGSPDVVPLLWKDCIITKLVANLSPAKMYSDVAVTVQPLSSHRDQFFTDGSRWDIIWAILLSIPFFCTIILSTIYRHGRKPTRIERRLTLDVSVVMIVAAVLVWFFLPTVRISPMSLRSLSDYRRLSIRIAHLAETGSITADLTAEQAATMPELSSSAYNPYTNDLIRRERSPGNFDIRTIDGQIYLCTYDIDSIEERTLLNFPTTASQPHP